MNFLKQFAVGLVAICAALVPINAESSNYFSSCSTSFYDWNITLGVDYLYWKPCSTDLDYTAEISERVYDGPMEFDIRRLCPSWKFGHRIYFEAQSCCWNSVKVYASFTHLCADVEENLSTDKGSFFPVNIHPFFGQLFAVSIGDEHVIFDSAKAQWDSDYKDWCFGSTYRYRLDRCQELISFFGLAGLHYNDSIAEVFNAVVPSLSETTFLYSHRSELDGVGLKLGSRYETTFCSNLSAFAEVSGSFVIGDSKSVSGSAIQFEFDEFPVEQEFIFNEEEQCRFIPGFYLGFGLNYQACICNFDFIFRIGYEFLAWYNLPSPRFFSESVEPFEEVFDASVIPNVALSTVDHSKTVSYHGVFVGIGISF